MLKHQKKPGFFNFPASLLPASSTVTLAALAFAVSCLLLPQIADASVVNRDDVKSFIDEMVKKHDFDREHLNKLFSSVKINNTIIEAITRPAESKPWYQYRPIFLKNYRIKEGVKFWRKFPNTLQRAYETYGVPPEIVIAIIGVETRYGKHKGTFPIIESLTTLAFEYPKRSKFFRSELEQFLLLTKEEKFNPLHLKGSYAGAMGKPQFISSSYRRYAVDFDKNGKRDILNTFVDTIGSVANYFREHNWYKDEPIASRAKVSGDAYKAIVKKGIKPSYTLKELKEQGITIEDNHSDSLLCALIELETKDGKEYWVGFNNFYVITRYNHSELYAMAAYQLSQEIVKYRAKITR